MNYSMTKTFREALIWHMEQTGERIVDICDGTGVSKDVINKLRARPNATTSAENAILISAYFGLSLEEFMKCASSDSGHALSSLVGLLTEEESRLLVQQVRGLLAGRGSR